jgi:hypothetical protein
MIKQQQQQQKYNKQIKIEFNLSKREEKYVTFLLKIQIFFFVSYYFLDYFVFLHTTASNPIKRKERERLFCFNA